MGIQVRLIITMALLVLLPLSISLISWTGLKEMDQELLEVAEEFEETKSLQAVYTSLAIAAYALEQESPAFEDDALLQLNRAEDALREYLAEQYRGVSSDDHQADESSRASILLREIGELIGQRWSEYTAQERLTHTVEIRDGLKALFADAEAGVLDAPVAARSARQRTIGFVLVACISSALICIAFSVWSTRGVFRRLRELRDAMASDSSSKPGSAPRDVPGMVTQIEELNRRMIERMEEKNRELLRRERMAGVGLLAADVAHEINNPLNAMLGLTELSLRTTGTDQIDENARKELHESLTVIRREVLRCSGIVKRLMAMVRGSSTPQRTDATRILMDSVSIAKAARPDRDHCFVSTGNSKPVHVMVPPDDLRQILLTLLINAADAVDNDGRIEYDTVETDREVWLRIRDNGRGFSASTQANFNVPFSTTRHAEGGTGLGLSIAHTIATDIGVEIRAESKGPGCGSTFVIAIPAQEMNA